MGGAGAGPGTAPADQLFAGFYNNKRLSREPRRADATGSLEGTEGTAALPTYLSSRRPASFCPDVRRTVSDAAVAALLHRSEWLGGQRDFPRCAWREGRAIRPGMFLLDGLVAPGGLFKDPNRERSEGDSHRRRCL